MMMRCGLLTSAELVPRALAAAYALKGDSGRAAQHVARLGALADPVAARWMLEGVRTAVDHGKNRTSRTTDGLGLAFLIH